MVLAVGVIAFWVAEGRDRGELRQLAAAAARDVEATAADGELLWDPVRLELGVGQALAAYEDPARPFAVQRARFTEQAASFAVSMAGDDDRVCLTVRRGVAVPDAPSRGFHEVHAEVTNGACAP